MSTKRVKKDDRSKVYYRLNPSGDKEQVITHKQSADDETLNEFELMVNSVLEGIEQDNNPALSAETPTPYRQTPQMVGSRGDSIRNLGDTITNVALSKPVADNIESSRINKLGQSNREEPEDKNIPVGIIGRDAEVGPKTFVRMESCTTAGIAIAPMPYEVKGSKRQPKKRKIHTTKPGGQWEHHMKSFVEKLLVEWEPEFVAGEYDPGEHQMDHLGGEGVAGRKSKPARGGHSAVDKNHGEPLGARHNETAAMCDVEESGVEDKPQGVHQSSVGDPLDGCCDEVGHNWPDQPKHKGGGVAEPAEGNRWTDGGTLHGSQMEWSPSKIGSLMGEDANLQNLFDSYARTTSTVDLDGFSALCEAHGYDVLLDESSLLGLMERNRDFVFYEAEDADGSYFTKEPASAEDMPSVGSDEGLEDGSVSSLDDEEMELDQDMESEPHTVTIDGVSYIPADTQDEPVEGLEYDEMYGDDVVGGSDEDESLLEPAEEPMAEEEEMPAFIKHKKKKSAKKQIPPFIKKKMKGGESDGGCY